MSSPASPRLLTPPLSGRPQRARRCTAHYGTMINSDEIGHSESEDDRFDDEDSGDESYGKADKGLKHEDSDAEMVGGEGDEGGDEADKKPKKRTRKKVEEQNSSAAKGRGSRATLKKKDIVAVVPSTTASRAPMIKIPKIDFRKNDGNKVAELLNHKKPKKDDGDDKRDEDPSIDSGDALTIKSEKAPSKAALKTPTNTLSSAPRLFAMRQPKSRINLSNSKSTFVPPAATQNATSKPRFTPLAKKIKPVSAEESSGTTQVATLEGKAEINEVAGVQSKVVSKKSLRTVISKRTGVEAEMIASTQKEKRRLETKPLGLPELEVELGEAVEEEMQPPDRGGCHDSTKGMDEDMRSVSSADEESPHMSQANSDAGGQALNHLDTSALSAVKEEEESSGIMNITHGSALDSSQNDSTTSQASKRKLSDDSNTSRPKKKLAPAEKITTSGRLAILEALTEPSYLKHIDFNSIKGSEVRQVSRHWREVLSQDIELAIRGKSSASGKPRGKFDAATRKKIWKVVCDAYDKADWKGVLNKYQEEEKSAGSMTISKLKRHFRDVMRKDGDKTCGK